MAALLSVSELPCAPWCRLRGLAAALTLELAILETAGRGHPEQEHTCCGHFGGCAAGVALCLELDGGCARGEVPSVPTPTPYTDRTSLEV